MDTRDREREECLRNRLRRAAAHRRERYNCTVVQELWPTVRCFIEEVDNYLNRDVQIVIWTFLIPMDMHALLVPYQYTFVQ